MTTDAKPQKRKRADTSSTTESTAQTTKRPRLSQALHLASEDDAKLLEVIESRYEIHLQSVISSSKIQQRVSSVLKHLSSTKTTPIPAPTTSDTTAQPKTRVSILRAKKFETPKLISIAEIAKRQIEKEGGEKQTTDAGGAGRWFQYIALGEELQQRPRNREGDSVVEDSVLGGRDADRDEEDDDDDDDFEVMKTPFERAIEGRPLIRAVPVMSLFLSRISIDELKKRYGEQTNIPTPSNSTKT